MRRTDDRASQTTNRETYVPLFPEVGRARPASVLVLRPGAIGDVLLTTPALRALRLGLPGSRIVALVTASGAEVLTGNPNVDEVMVLDKSSLVSQLGVIPRVRRAGFDLVIDFLCNPRTALISIFSGARFRLGYDVRLRRTAYNLQKPRDEYRDGRKVVKYAAEVNLDMIRCLGIGETDASLDFQVSRDSQEKVDAFLRSRGLEGKRTAGVCPAGSWPAKTWPLEKFAAFADRITKELGCAVVILWGPGEEVLAERMASLMKTQGLVACRTDIEEAGALLRRCELFVSNDSGLKHIAVAVGTATVTIFGPTNPITWNPPDPRHRAVHTDADCLFCDRNECDSMVCMENLEVSDVLSVSKEVLRLDRESSTI